MNVATALAIALLHSFWQVALVAGSARLLERWFRRHGPRLHYAIHFNALMLAGLAFVVTFATQLDSRAAVVPPADTIGTQLSGTWSTALPLVAVALWSLGATAMSGRLVWAWCSLWRLRARAQPIEGKLRERVDALRAKLGVRKPVDLLESADVDGPVTAGWLRPCILLPVGLATGLSPAVLDAALAHELAHVGRRDFLANLAQSLVEVVLFHHPATWWLSRKIREQREWCCDDRATQQVVAPFEYARALAELESFRLQPQPTRRLELAATGGALMSRIRRLVEPNPPTSIDDGPSRPLLASVLVLSGIIVGGIACAPAVSEVVEPAASRTAAVARDATPVDDASAPSIEQSASDADLPDSLRPYESQLVDAAHAHGVPVRLLAIITMLESRGDPQARSPIGARGLMQIMPATAARIAEERGIEGHTPEKLDDPAYNVDMGAYYLAEQLRTFGDVALAAAAYNAGPSRVRAHVEEGAALPDETQRYRERVADAWADAAPGSDGSSP